MKENIEELGLIFEDDFKYHGFDTEECKKAGRIIIDYYTLLEKINSKEGVIQID